MANAQKIAVVSNPQSGHNRHKGIGKFEALIAAHGAASAQAVGFDEMEAALKTLAAARPEILVINGGDGSVDMAVNLMRNQKIFEKEPALALLKGGTTNLIHRDVGLRDRPGRALKRILSRDLRVVERRPLEIRRAGNDEVLYGFFMGTGAVPRAIEEARKTLHSKGLRGHAGEVLMLASVLARLRFKRDLEGDAVLSPAPLMIDDAEKQHIFCALTSLQKLVPGVSSPAEADKIGGLYVGGEKRVLERAQYECLHLSTAQPWVLDGEMQDAGEIDVRMGKALKFLVA